MNATLATLPLRTDVIIIGAGPVGLFAVFELGLLDLKCHLLDILTKPGGQCAELYPEKPIYDIPGLPRVTGQELTQRLMAQSDRFQPQYHFGQQAESLSKTEDGLWQITTQRGLKLCAPVVVIAAGGGSFVPKKPAIPGIENYEGRSVHYSVCAIEQWRGRDVVVAGAGDSALDWALTLQPIARRVTLLHRRPEFRAAPDSVQKLLDRVAGGSMDLELAELTGLHGQDGQLTGLQLQNEQRGDYVLPCDALLPFYGLTMKLGPIADFGLNLHENRIQVDTEKFETTIPGLFAIGDINSYPGKLKLILSGFHEAALMSQAAFRYCRPGQKLRFQYTTTSSVLQKKLATG